MHPRGNSKHFRTRERVQTILPSLPSHCWRREEPTSLLHIWWNCPKIPPFWKELHRLTNQITTYNLDFTPTAFVVPLLYIKKCICALSSHAHGECSKNVHPSKLAFPGATICNRLVCTDTENCRRGETYSPSERYPFQIRKNMVMLATFRHNR